MLVKLNALKGIQFYSFIGYFLFLLNYDRAEYPQRHLALS